ncbi:hypothetical protein CDCA_CDCA13G3590 [Cyanidium caldarium]|uniref:Metallo-beta-lactamase domain-containing protein n=1 Tax=Cyanidium caldarium TaxID=2771 RepID=A0AAV9IZM4_CYACA|nr:hypothetical protein CDCA_CDCA13G3590 [Cyanidium caldarium]
MLRSSSGVVAAVAGALTPARCWTRRSAGGALAMRQQLARWCGDELSLRLERQRMARRLERLSYWQWWKRQQQTWQQQQRRQKQEQRRRGVPSLAAGTLATVSGTATAEGESGATEMVPAHHVYSGDGRRRVGFRNPWDSARPDAGMLGFLRVLREWDTARSRVSTAELQALADASCRPDFEAVQQLPTDEPGLAATWIGHAAFILQFPGTIADMDGATNAPATSTPQFTTVWTDPVFGERASPFRFMGPRRLVPAHPRDACPLPDIVCFSHNHYDHLDVGTVRGLVQRSRRLGRRITWLCPLGVGALLRDTDAFFGGHVPREHDVIELDWFDEVTVGCIKFVLTPAQHTSGRGLLDRNGTLWGGWAMIHQPTDTRCYFAGDTAYRVVDRGDAGYPYPSEEQRREAAAQGRRAACPAFAEIGKRYGPFDLALLPIGAYSPRWFMSRVHVDPTDAVAIHADVRARASIGMHHSTFVLTDEGLRDPLRRLERARQAAGLSEHQFMTLQHGETRLFTRSTADKKEPDGERTDLPPDARAD